MRTYAAWLFGAAALFNALVGLALMFGGDTLGAALGLAPVAGTNLLFAKLSAGFILLFAYAYLRLALDPITYRPFIAFSALGKLVAVAIMVWLWLAGVISFKVPALGAGDLLFAAVFLDYLRRTPGARQA